MKDERLIRHFISRLDSRWNRIQNSRESSREIYFLIQNFFSNNLKITTEKLEKMVTFAKNYIKQF